MELERPQFGKGAPPQNSLTPDSKRVPRKIQKPNRAPGGNPILGILAKRPPKGKVAYSLPSQNPQAQQWCIRTRNITKYSLVLTTNQQQNNKYFTIKLQ